jgi:hypothetical protein
MSSVVQTSLFDLAAGDEPTLNPLGSLGAMVTRQRLRRDAWVDLLPG